MAKKTWHGVDPSSPEYAAHVLASNERSRLEFSSEGLERAENCYVAWFDVMGAGHMMTTSMDKSANALSRIHLALHVACADHKHSVQTLPINDGVYVITKTKIEIINMLFIHLLPPVPSWLDQSSACTGTCSKVISSLHSVLNIGLYL